LAGANGLALGWANSIQKLFYLPLAHTDFVFSIWAEETGFVGALVVIGLFVALVTRIIQVGIRALRHGDEFAAYVCFGVSLVFSGQVFVNIGMSSGLLPTKGLTLPFISYGGSSLLVSAVMLALVLRIERTIPRSAGGGQ
jgi:cell division protein FtsW